MELIKIFFFAIGSFFGVEGSRVLAEKTIVTINPEKKTITVQHENLITLIQNKNDSLEVKSELEKIVISNPSWSSEFKNYTKKEKNFYISDDKKTLNSNIILTYETELDLKPFGIGKNKDGKFSMTNFPKLHIKSTDGKLGERYWNFDPDKPFTFTLEPLTDMPKEFKIHQKSLLPFWQMIKI